MFQNQIKLINLKINVPFIFLNQIKLINLKINIPFIFGNQINLKKTLRFLFENKMTFKILT